jgi:dimethylglycine catabolism A
MESYPALLAPTRLAGKALRNRVIHASMTTELVKDGAVSDALVQYHVSRAIGGAALIVTEPLGMATHQRALNRPQVIPENLDSLRRWAEAVESHDCRLIGQIQDSGRGRHYSGRTHDAIGASALADDLSWTVPHELDVDEIEALIAEFAEASRVLRDCGFSGIELSAGHGHLFHQFLSPWCNRREDAYGGDWSGRTRLVIELMTAIRARCGDEFIIGLKLPGDDGIPGSIGVVEAKAITSMLTATGYASYVCICQGAHARSLEMHLFGSVTLRDLQTLDFRTQPEPEIPALSLKQQRNAGDDQSDRDRGCHPRSIPDNPRLHRPPRPPRREGHRV